MSTEPLRIRTQTVVGTNARGYTFAVGLVGDRWLGYALGGGGLFVFSEVSRGVDLGMGLDDREEAIGRVAALAQDPGHGFGGVDRWHVPERLRADPEVYRCEICGEVLCDSDHDDYRDGLPEED